MVSTVLFVSVRNAARSQMAAAWVTALAHPGKVRAVSAGISPADAVDNHVVDAMKEVGINLASSTPGCSPLSLRTPPAWLS
jgi:protein-tyrosine-phosphatase